MLVTVVVLVHAVQPHWVVESRDLLTTGHLRFAVVNPMDLILIPFALLAPAGLRAAWRQRPISAALWIASLLAVGGLAALAVHPSLRGALIVFRLSALVGLVWAISGFTRQELVRNLALPVLAVSAAEGILAVAQLVTDSALLPRWTGAIDPVTTDGVARAAGTLGHAYEASALALLALGFGVAVYRDLPLSWRRWWPALIAAGALPAAISFSRAVLIGVIVIALALLFGIATESRDWLVPLGALLLGVALPAALFSSGWTERVEHSVAGLENSGANLRTEQLDQALSLIERDWLLGVGPGLYSVTLESRVELDPQRAYPIHNVPLYIAAEDGVIVAGLLMLFALALAIHSLRRSTENRALFVAMIPIALFDVLLYTAPAGLLMLSWWLGGLAALESRPEL